MHTFSDDSPVTVPQDLALPDIRLRDAAEFEPVEQVEGDPTGGFLLVCDHARNALPPEYGNLGLGAVEFDRHIAYDIGVRDVTLALAERLNAPAVLSRFSRLLIDPNRGLDDPTLVMRVSDGAIVPGNAAVDLAEKERRIERYYRPYDNAVAGAIQTAVDAGLPPAIVSIHSFTPAWKGAARPWHVGVLWDNDPRLAVPLIAALQSDPGLVVGDNEPYTGELQGDTMNRHGTRGGYAHALIEIRQDLIADKAGAFSWAKRIGDILETLRGQQGLNTIRQFG